MPRHLIGLGAERPVDLDGVEIEDGRPTQGIPTTCKGDEHDDAHENAKTAPSFGATDGNSPLPEPRSIDVTTTRAPRRR